MVIDDLANRPLGADLVFKGGLHVYTTLSPAMQLKAEASLRDGVLYELLALVDAIRGGRARERKLAVAELEARLS